MNFQVNLHTFIGAGGAPIIQQAIQFLRIQFRLPVFLAPWVSLVLAMVEQVGLAYYFHFGVESALIGIAATLPAVFLTHEITSN